MTTSDQGRARTDAPRDAAPESSHGVVRPSWIPRRKLVVVIGIDEYDHLPKLRHAVSDAMEVQKLLVSQFGFEAPIDPLTDKEATKRAIEALLEDTLGQLVNGDDVLILFFAGHGTTKVVKHREYGYIAPVEARENHYGDMIDMESLLKSCGKLEAQHIVVILDACHSALALGPAVKQYRSAGSYQDALTSKRSCRVITSARGDELASDNGPLPNHSLFTGTLIQGLRSREADLDGNGIITFSELALFLQQRVGQASESRQTPDFGWFEPDERGELVLDAPAVAGGTGTNSTLPPRDSTGTGPRDDRGKRSHLKLIVKAAALLIAAAFLVGVAVIVVRRIIEKPRLALYFPRIDVSPKVPVQRLELERTGAGESGEEDITLAGPLGTVKVTFDRDQQKTKPVDAPWGEERRLSLGNHSLICAQEGETFSATRIGYIERLPVEELRLTRSDRSVVLSRWVVDKDKRSSATSLWVCRDAQQRQRQDETLEVLVATPAMGGKLCLDVPHPTEVKIMTRSSDGTIEVGSLTRTKSLGAWCITPAGAKSAELARRCQSHGIATWKPARHDTNDLWTAWSPTDGAQADDKIKIKCGDISARLDWNKGELLEARGDQDRPICMFPGNPTRCCYGNGRCTSDYPDHTVACKGPILTCPR